MVRMDGYIEHGIVSIGSCSVFFEVMIDIDEGR